jgi:lipid A 4'-phosphatase
LQYLPIIGVIVVIGIMLRDYASGLRWSNERIRISTIALVTFALGPGLLVNGYMKSFIGRPRPANTVLFGGEHAFVAAGKWSYACFSNCSFVSGEAAGMTWIFCLLPLWPYRDRYKLILLMTAIVTATALLRVAFGRHYLSDVVLGALSTLVVFSAIACLCEGLTERHERMHKQLAAKAAAL